jgi:hypothetical protein
MTIEELGVVLARLCRGEVSIDTARAAYAAWLRRP